VGPEQLQPWQEPGAVRRDCEPHRAHLLLRLGSVGFLLGLLSPLALPGLLAAALGVAVHEMGKRDLARMAAGRMDPQSEADTRLAMWRGDVGTVLGFCGGVLCAPVFVLNFASFLVYLRLLGGRTDLRLVSGPVFFR
jgi:hypothetical protein